MNSDSVSVMRQAYSPSATPLPASRTGTAARSPGGDPRGSEQAAPADVHAAPTAADQQQMQRAAERANQALAQKSRELTFEFNEDVDRVVVKLVDKRTGEVLRQFPSEELLVIARALENDSGAGALLRTDS